MHLTYRQLILLTIATTLMYDEVAKTSTPEMKIFQRNKYAYPDYQYQHYQFLIIKGKTLLHLMYEDDNPCPYTGIRILTSFLAPDHLFSMSVEFKGYSWSFYLFSNYWED